MSPSDSVSQTLARAIRAGAAIVLFLALQPNTSSAQPFGVPIQLPSTSVFSIDTTVSVPDGGAISLGGNSGSAWSSTRSGGRFRPFGNRAIGGSQFASNASVHVQIISLAEMEAELLSQLPGDRSLEDYARPQSPELIIRQTQHASAPRKAIANPQPDRATPPAESRSTARSNSRQAATRKSTADEPTRADQARFNSEVVDPNGSKQVQEKADFMSRHIGRKKK